MFKHFPMRTLVLLSLASLAAPLGSPIAAAQAPTARAPARPGATVFFLDLKDGQTVPSKFTAKFGATNVEVVAAGVTRPFTGHHHLLIDTPLPPLDQPIPSDVNHLHFGRGQTEAEVILPAGEHTLQLLLGDADHVPHNPPIMSQVIRVRVDPATVEKPRTPAPAGASVFFPDLKDGATIPAKSIVKFGITGMELVAAGVAKPNTGHHHLIIDAPLPPLDREIPADLNYVHFGRAQTEAEVVLTPGQHTLQLLLGDQDHVPHDPPVMSERITVTVAPATEGAVAQRPTGLTPAPPDASVYFIYPRNGERIYPRSTIRFGLRNMGVAPAGIDKPNTGHHHLIIDAPTPPLDRPIPTDFNHIHFGNGQTERKITLKPGKHTLQLILGDANHVPFDPPIMTERIEVIVGGVVRKPTRKRRR